MEARNAHKAKVEKGVADAFPDIVFRGELSNYGRMLRIRFEHKGTFKDLCTPAEVDFLIQDYQWWVHLLTIRIREVLGRN